MLKIEDTPLVSIGVVVLNREWIIRETLNSILSQTYPHEKIFILVVDGGSHDKTVETARKILEKADFCGYEIIVQKCNIPEGRNICIERMIGELLLFWDSDILMDRDAIKNLVDTLKNFKGDIVTAETCFINADSINKAISKMKTELQSKIRSATYEAQLVPASKMGHTLIRREVFNYVRFDPDLTLYEDLDFSVRAREKGFKILKNPGILAFDINLENEYYSDIFTEMPLKKALKGLRKKAKAKILSFNFTINIKDFIKYFWENKRYLFYMGYLPAIILSFVGFCIRSLFFSTAFLVYLGGYILYQLKKRGVKKGLTIFVKSLLVGLPLSFLMIYYFVKNYLNK
jgi:glycosyltransferase involved in cell wall biosynthesis